MMFRYNTININGLLHGLLNGDLFIIVLCDMINMKVGE